MRERLPRIMRPQKQETPEEHFRRTGIGSVFFLGTSEPPNSEARIDQIEIETNTDFFRRMLSDLNRPSRSWKTPRLQSAIEGLLEAGEAKAVIRGVNSLSRGYQEHLREHVDLWIGTGQDPATGIDRPSHRSPNRRIHEIVGRVFETHRAVPIPLRDGYGLSPVPRGTLRTDGDNGLETAELLFVEMLLNPWRLRISKCVKCDKYFKLKHWLREYRKGTVCPRCMPRRRNENSKQYKKELRVKAQETLYKLAARRFLRQIVDHPGWDPDGALKNRIAKYLTDQIKRSPQLTECYRSREITGKWLGWQKNRDGIENEARAIGRA
jgi:hypothetical protein